MGKAFEAAGLPCIISDVIPVDVDLTKNVKRISLAESDIVWADLIINQKMLDENERLEMNEIVSQTKYNIKNCKEKLIDIYKLDNC